MAQGVPVKRICGKVGTPRGPQNSICEFSEWRQKQALPIWNGRLNPYSILLKVVFVYRLFNAAFHRKIYNAVFVYIVVRLLKQIQA